jgi:heptosyltransferase-2
MKKIKILIIKLGYSETLDPEIGRHVSLGDVLRTTPILEALNSKYENSYISWLVSKEAESLLHNNEYINRILIWDEFVSYQLLAEKFDLVINLEKIPGICALSNKIDAWSKHGFRFNSETGKYDGYEQGLEFVDYINQKRIGKISNDCWQKSLIELLGLTWKEQKYSLGYKPKSQIKYDIGLNFQVGKKWPEKAMTMNKWEDLSSKLDKELLTYSWQEGLDSIYDYIEWINSCKILVTQDSLGMHLAFALNKRVVALFGPTSHSEVFFAKNHKLIVAKEQNMDNIDISTIMKDIKLLNKKEE